MNFRRIISVIFLLLTISVIVQAQNSPTFFLKATQVDESGNVSLLYTHPRPTDEFKYYIVYHSTNISGPYDSIATIYQYDAEPSVYNHLFLQNTSQTEQNFYFLNSLSTNDIAFDSDILSTIYLDHETYPSNDSVKLIFNYPYTYGLVTPNFKPCTIFARYDGGDWIKVDSTINNEYVYKIQSCEESIEFYVEIKTKGNPYYSSISNITPSISLFDESISIPFMDSVSIDHSSNQVIVGWEKSEDPNFAKYILLHEVPNPDPEIQNYTWQEFAEIEIIDSIHTFDDYASICNESISYQISAEDNCGWESGSGIGPNSIGEFLSTIHHYEPEYNPCFKTILLKWSSDICINGGIEEYEIHSTVDGIETINTISWPDTSFTMPGIEYGKQYSFFIRAKSGNVTSSSCIKDVFATEMVQAEYVYFQNVSVVNENVEIKIYPDNEAGSNGFYLYRSILNENNFEQIDFIEYQDISPIIYIDTAAETNLNSYQYYVSVVDYCDIEGIVSNYLNTILLRTSDVSLPSVSLEWNPSEGWNGDVEEYRLYRIVNGSVLGSPLIFDSNTSSGTDILSNIENGIAYYIEAIESENEYGIKGISRSNIVSIPVETDIQMPNAFRPNGISPEFKPPYYSEFDEYHFAVYNRWGQQIWETNNPEEGWDGYINGKIAPQGAYVYFIKAISADQTPSELKGTFIVIY